MCSNRQIENPSAATLRLFVAVDLPDALRGRLAIEQKRLSSRLPGVRWVPVEQFHLTIGFLGMISAIELPRLADALIASARAAEMCELSVSGLGCFGRPRMPRVLWAGIEAHPDLTRLFVAVGREFTRAGHPPVNEPYGTPHLTLGRVKSPPEKSFWPNWQVIKRQATGHSFGVLNLTMLHLMRSTLAPAGAIHESLFAAPIGMKPPGICAENRQRMT